jgi:transposase
VAVLFPSITLFKLSEYGLDAGDLATHPHPLVRAYRLARTTLHPQIKLLSSQIHEQLSEFGRGLFPQLSGYHLNHRAACERGPDRQLAGG